VFWSLKDYSLFSDLLEGKHPQELTHTLLADARDRILGKLKEAREERTRPMQKFAKITVDLSSQSGLLRTLKKTGSANFYLPPVRKTTTGKESPFIGFANVRVTNVRAWAHGLQTTANGKGVRLHHLVLTQLGAETLVTRDDEPHTFSHEPVDSIVIYNSSFIGKEEAFAKDIDNVEDGTLTATDGDNVYAHIGPFGKWRIDIIDRKDGNEPISLEHLNKVEIEFSGFNQRLRL